MAATRNIRLTLDEDTLVEARVLAAQEGLSLSGLLHRELVKLIERRRRYAKARESALRRLLRGRSLGMGTPVTREELHDDRDSQLRSRRPLVPILRKSL